MLANEEAKILVLGLKLRVKCRVASLAELIHFICTIRLDHVGTGPLLLHTVEDHFAGRLADALRAVQATGETGVLADPPCGATASRPSPRRFTTPNPLQLLAFSF